MKNYVDLLKLPPRILAGLATASGLLIFLPDNIISRLYMSELKTEYGFIIGVVFILSISILSCYGIIKVSKSIIKVYNNRKFLRLRKEFMKKLNYEDKRLLREMMNQPNKTLDLPMNNGTVIKLSHYKVITPAGTSHLVNPLDMRIPYFIQPWVVDEINENPHLLSLN